MALPEKSGAKAASSSNNPSNRPGIISGETLGALEESIRRAIADRAYEIYQSRGRDHGNDMQDWFTAERELVKPLDIQIKDAGAQLNLRAKVPGFAAANIQIGVSPHRLIIWGQAARAGSAAGKMQMLSEIDLPGPVDPAKTSATVSDDVLLVQAAKAKPGAS